MDSGPIIETESLVAASRRSEFDVSALDRSALAYPRSHYRPETDRRLHPADDAHTRQVAEPRDVSADVLHAWAHSFATGDAADTNRLVLLAHAIRAAEIRSGVGIIG